MLSASPFILLARRFRVPRSGTRSEFRSSYFKNTPKNNERSEYILRVREGFEGNDPSHSPGFSIRKSNPSLTEFKNPPLVGVIFYSVFIGQSSNVFRAEPK